MKDQTALFLGKFQPPHLGHVRTILRVHREYAKVIIGITRDRKVMEGEEVKAIFDEVFASFDSIETMLIEGVVEQGTAKIPEGVDVILSGNRKVLERLEGKYPTKFVERTEGIGYSATEIRNISLGTKALSLRKLNTDLKMEVTDIGRLKPLEKVLPSHLANIQTMIEKEGIVRKPLIVDREYGVVLDGSHRYAYLMKEGYRKAPVIFVDYEDESIFVGNHLRHRFVKDENFTISKAEVRERALHEKLYPPRTTRHFFPFRKEDHPVALQELQKGAPRDIGHLIEQIPTEEEIRIDRNYIAEIDEEIRIIEKYLQEQIETKRYLQRQIEMMENERK